jgi:hypothetical protein
MIYYTTYFDQEIQEEIIQTLGPAYGFRDFFKLGAVGSSRMTITDFSTSFKKLIESTSDFAVASISLRPKGILVTVSKSYKNICWVIPYYRLTVYKTDVLSIHASGEFLKLKLHNKQNYKFISKLLAHKMKYQEELGLV